MTDIIKFYTHSFLKQCQKDCHKKAGSGTGTYCFNGYPQEVVLISGCIKTQFHLKHLSPPLNQSEMCSRNLSVLFLKWEKYLRTGLHLYCKVKGWGSIGLTIISWMGQIEKKLAFFSMLLADSFCDFCVGC